MNRIVRVATLLATLAISFSAFAGSGSQSITLYHDAMLNGSTIPAGEYTVKYDTDGTTANVKVVKGKKEFASASGQMKTLDHKVDATQVVLQHGSGTPTISEIDFGGKNSGITFGEVSASTGK